MQRPGICFPPFALGRLLICLAVLDVHPRKYWWRLLHRSAKVSLEDDLTKGDRCHRGRDWLSTRGIPGNLGVFWVEIWHSFLH